IYDCDEKPEIDRHLDAFYEKLGKNEVILSDTCSKIISASAGFAWTDDWESSISELLSHADEALYEVKKATKGCYAEYGKDVPR
nr:GGDEF domain-containing protein [Lachnospiraceae bacterium]